MDATKVSGWVCAWVIAMSIPGTVANAKKLERGPVQDPVVVATVDASTLRVGTITFVQERDGMLFVAGTDGIAAVSGEGKPLWAARLPRADLRTIDVDGSNIAVVSQDFNVPEPAGFLKRFYEGSLADFPRFKNSSLALLDKGRRGAIVWTVLMGGTTWVAPPCLGPVRIAYSDGRTMALVNRTDGTVGARAKTVVGGAIIDALVGAYRDANTRNKPVYVGNGFFSGFESELALVDPVSGTDRWRKGSFGLTPIQNITAGPIIWGDKIVFGNSPIPSSNPSTIERTFKIGIKPRVFVTDAKGDQVWNDTLDDDYGGIGSLAVRGDRLFVATNMTLGAYDRKGHQLWFAGTARKNGALTLTPARGVRYLKESFAVRLSPGFCLTADDRYVYLSSYEFSEFKLDYAHWWAQFNLGVNWYDKMAYGGRQVVTVVDAASGAYVTTLDAKGAINDLLVVGTNLVVTDHHQVRFLKPPP
jgi:hypothetical protein